MKKFLTLSIMAVFCFTANAQMILTGVLDGPLTGGTKVLEVYAVNNIPDISIYGVELVSNGGGSSGNVEYQFPAVSVNAGDFIYFANDSTNCFNYLGFYPLGISGTMNFNGDDALILYENGAPIDHFGYDNVDGSGTSWEYMDTWAYRNSMTGPDGAFIETNWTFGTVNELDGATTNATSANPFPFGTYVYGVPSNPTVSFIGSGTSVYEWDGSTTVEVAISAPNGNMTSVNIVLDPSSTADASDVTISPTMVSFPANSGTPQMVTITINDDAMIEPTETAVLTLTNPTNGAMIGNGMYSIDIVDNDTPVPAIVITELMYNLPTVDSLEFLELYNNDVVPVDLNGFSFTSGVTHTFTTPTVLNPGEFLVLTGNVTGMQTAFGVTAQAWTSGGLNNTGETITLVDASGNIVDLVTYTDDPPYPTEPDGFGPSLELCDVNGDNAGELYWVASQNMSGFVQDTIPVLASPGMANAGCPCNMPSNVVVNLGTDPNRVNISWDPEPAAIEYQVRYRRVLTTTWNNLATTNPFRAVQVLVQNKVYDYRIRTKCDDGNGGFMWSAMTPIDKFRTVPCDAPTGMFSTQLSSNKVRVEWAPYTYADKYQIWYRVAGSNDAWGSLVTYLPGMVARVISNLTPGETYEWQVRSFCEVSYGPWTDLQYFTNASARVGQFDFALQGLFPNPAQSHVSATFTLPKDSNVTLTVTDILGREVFASSSDFAEGANTARIDLSGLDGGYYIFKMTDGENVSVKKFVKK